MSSSQCKSKKVGLKTVNQICASIECHFTHFETILIDIFQLHFMGSFCVQMFLLQHTRCLLFPCRPAADPEGHSTPHVAWFPFLTVREVLLYQSIVIEWPYWFLYEPLSWRSLSEDLGFEMKWTAVVRRSKTRRNEFQIAREKTSVEEIPCCFCPPVCVTSQFPFFILTVCVFWIQACLSPQILTGVVSRDAGENRCIWLIYLPSMINLGLNWHISVAVVGRLIDSLR